MSESDEMFKELGYEMTEIYNGYLYTDKTGFNIKITNMKRIDLYYNEEVEMYENLMQLTFEELQAINEKVKELRLVKQLNKEIKKYKGEYIK